MDTYKSFLPLIKARQKRLKAVCLEKEKHLKSAPDGYLKILNVKGKDRYYHVASKDRGTGDYIRGSNIQIAKALAQKSYDLKVLKAADSNSRHGNSSPATFQTPPSRRSTKHFPPPDKN